LIKILIVNFYYDLIMPNTVCAVILQKKEGYTNMYGHILYIIIYIGVSGIVTCFDFFVSYFLKFRNALGNEKTTKLVFIFKYMRSSSWIKNYIMYANLSIQIYSLKNKFYSIHKSYW